MKRWKLSQAAEWVVLRNALAMYGAFTGVAGVLCYRSIWTVVCCLPMLVFFYRQEQNRVQQKRMVRLRQELKEFMGAMSAALMAGYALENTLPLILEDLAHRFPEGSELGKECEHMIAGRQMQKNTEQLFLEMAQRVDIKELHEFCEVIVIAKRRGGNLIELIREAILGIEEQLRLQDELCVMTAAKTLELKVMLIVPFGLLLYLRLTSPGYLDVFYHNLFGIVFMSGSLVVIAVAYIWSQRILTRLEK